MSKLITFLSDFGSIDGYPAACKAVIKAIHPQADIVDISHEISPFDVRQGAFVLATTAPYFPLSVHLAVVDPGVGSIRRIVIIETGRGDLLLGPDNGLLIPAGNALGSISKAYELSLPPKFLATSQAALPAPTFQARDLMAPAAARLAKNVPPDELGAAIEVSGLESAPWPEPIIEEKTYVTEIINIDRFGTARTGISAALLAQSDLSPGKEVIAQIKERQMKMSYLEAFYQAKTGEPLLLIDSSGFLSLAINQGSAAGKYKLVVADLIKISW